MDTLPVFDGYDGHFVSPRLAVGSCPMPQHVAAIEAAGIRGILNLVAICEARSIAYVHQLPPSIYWIHLAFWDGYLGVNQQGYRERLTEGFARHVVQKAAVTMRDRSPVLVHCMGGIGRAGNMATILLAASEGMTLDEANAHIRQYRPAVAGFCHDGFWKEAGGEALVELARETMAQPSALPQGISPFLSKGWQLSDPLPPADITTVPYIGLDQAAGWKPVPSQTEFVDVNELCDGESLVYLARTVEAPMAGEWILHVGHDGGVRVFVDGQPVAAEAGLINPAPYQRTQARLHWPAGRHELVIALDRAGGMGWGIYVSFEPAESMQAPGRKTVFPA